MIEINSLKLKTKQLKLRTTWYNSHLHESIDFGYTYICTTVEFVFCRIKNNKTED